MPYLFILGAKDPEMDRIEEILQNANQVFTQAKVNGVRVHAGNTYTVDEIPNLNQYTPVWIECSKFEPGHGIYIDHHRPGDVGYSKPPAHFWKASSLGQLHELLDLKPSHNDIVLAAMDHCFAPALQGECPGVTPEEVRFIKYLEIEKTTGANLQEINSLVDLYTQTLSTTPTVRIGSEDVYDLRSLYLGEGIPESALCASCCCRYKAVPYCIIETKSTLLRNGLLQE
ncbi:MAG: hypothetical protein R3B53_00365 [Candidatus Paceibacterota bacterium]